MRALVLGGHGAVGAGIVSALRAAGDIALAAGPDPARADRFVDLHDPATLRTATADVDVVINASGMEDPDAVAALTELGSAVVDITATRRMSPPWNVSTLPARCWSASGWHPG
jgi:uncharacterized protein YbjT (DUF2867 family)